MAIFGSIGIVPSPDSMGIFTFQFKSVEADDAPRKTFKLQSLNSLSGPDNTNLYVAVQAVNVVRGNGVEFEIFHWTGKSDRIFSTDVDDWAVFVCFGLVFLLAVAACVLGIVYCIARKGDDELYDEYKGQSALQQQRANQDAEEKARKLYGADYRGSTIHGNGSTIAAVPMRESTVHGGGYSSAKNSGVFVSNQPSGTFAQQTFAGQPIDEYTMDAAAPQQPYNGGIADRGRLTSATSFYGGEHDAQW